MNLTLLHIITGIFTFFALYFFLLDFMNAPTKKTVKTIFKLSKPNQEFSKAEMVTLRIGADLGKYIPLSDYRKRVLAQKLKSAGMTITPETYVGQAAVIPLICLGLGMIALIIFPVAFILFAVLGILFYYKGTNSIDDEIKKIREELEFELPRFVSTLCQYLGHDRDVLKFLEMYRRSAGPKFKHELDICVADMKSGNIEKALKNLDTRVNSSMLSDVTRGLISLTNGSASKVYFEMLDNDFRKIEYERLRSMAIKRPGKIKKYNILLLFCFLAMFLSVFAVEIMNSAKNFM